MTAFLHEVLASVELGEDDRQRLSELHEILAPHFAEIAATFYVSVPARPGLAAILSDTAELSRLERTLIEWMSTGLRGPYDATFASLRSSFGRRHAEIGFAQRDVLASIQGVRRAYRERILGAYSAAHAHGATMSADKLLDVELAVMLRHHQLATESRLVASEQQRRRERIEAMQTLCAGLAHEMRNPLNSAKLQLELLERRLRRETDDPKLTAPIALAHEEIARLATLIDEFLTFAQPPPLNVSRHDVVAVVRAVIEHERPDAEQRGVELRFAGDPGPVVAEIDPGKIEQVIENLVCNAVEAVAAGGHVSVAVVAVDGHVHIRVVDDGPGIPPDVLARISEPFFTTKAGGTGMGMSIAHSLIGLHDGSIEISTSPRGTTADVAVPIRIEGL